MVHKMYDIKLPKAKLQFLHILLFESSFIHDLVIMGIATYTLRFSVICQSNDNLIFYRVVAR